MKLTSKVKSEKVKTGVLKGYKASIKLNENSTPSYFEFRKLFIHLLLFVVAKLKKMVEEGILEHVPPAGSKWASPIVALQKS